nr:hypothetical protein [Paraglaciecola arctica]
MKGALYGGRFLFNPDGICVAQEVQADSVGLNVNELLRQIEAWQYAIKLARFALQVGDLERKHFR